VSRADDTREQTVGVLGEGLLALGHVVAAAEARPGQLEPPEMHVGERRVLGRSNSCDYAIPDPTVSTRHAELIRDGAGWLVRDLNSRNGTRVNGGLIKEQRLSAGDTLALGTTAFVFWPPSH
jgi:predicted component of type VI protein secretion system